MTNNNSQNGSIPFDKTQGKSLTTKGFAMPMIIGIIALVLVVAGVGYYATQKQPQTSPTTQAPAGEKTLPDGTVVKADGTMIKPDGTMVKPDGTVIKPDGTMVKPDGTMVKPDGTMEKKEGEMMMKKDDGTMMAKYTGTVLAGKSAPLIDYNKTDYDAAVKSDKLVALYFIANWCPICKVELPKLYAAFNELTTDKVIGFQINYNDSDTDANEKNLAREFNVTYQHTKVFLKNGKQILKSPESWSKEQHLSEINKAITQ